MSFRPYVEAGLKLCPIRDGEKSPSGSNWNSPERALTIAQAERVTAAGLMHAYSGTAALDLDNVDLTRAWLAPHGIDLDALMNANDAVRITSGTPNRGKLLYAMPEPLRSKKIAEKIDGKSVTLFELRCATADGKSVQDVLPPSPHPSGRTYEWSYGDDLTGDWRTLPPIPDALLALWRELIRGSSEAAITGAAPAPREDIDEALLILSQQDPDTDYDTWLKLGMALEHDLGDAGWALWDAWSAKGKKYPGSGQLQQHWQSFGRNTSATPVTLGSFKRTLVSTKDDFDDVSGEDFTTASSNEGFEALKRARVHTWRDIRKQPWPEWHIRKLLPRKELVQFYGPSGIGKSALALCMALSLHLGKLFLDISVKRRRVLWIAAEAFGSMRLRLTAYAKANEINPDELEGFEVLEGCNLNDVREVAFIARLVKEGKYEAVFVDTLAAASPGTDENSGKDMGLVRQACLDIVRPAQATCVLIHHTGKDESRGARGHSSNRAAVDAELRAYFDDELGCKVLSTEKMRDGSDDLAWKYELSVLPVGIDDEDETVTSVAVKFGAPVNRKRPDSREQPQSRPETGEAIETGCATLFEALADLESRGIKATRSAVEGCHLVKAAGFGVTAWRSVMKLLEEQDVIAPAGRRGAPLPVTLLPEGATRRAAYESLAAIPASQEAGA